MKIKKAGLFSRGKIILPPTPDLTVDSLFEELIKDFSPKSYQVYKTSLIGSDIVIKKSGWTGVFIKLKQKADSTTILFNIYAPSAMVRVLFMGVIPVLILHNGKWKEMNSEFSDWASKSPLLNR